VPKAIFEKNVTRLTKFAQVMSESRQFGVNGRCLAIIHGPINQYPEYKFALKTAVE